MVGVVVPPDPRLTWSIPMGYNANVTNVMRMISAKTVSAQAVVNAGAVRFHPMLLRAAALVVGPGVVPFDPIFQRLALSRSSSG